MFKLPYVLLATAMTAFFWGVYGVVLRSGTHWMNLKQESFQGELGIALRAFVGVGLAYFLIAVLVPVALLNRKRETGYWSVSGTIMALFAGAVGALGALGVSLALAFKAPAIIVMPIVFGGAPVVNTLLTSYLNKSFNQIKPLFMIGMLMVALGMVGVFINRPAPTPSKDHSNESKAQATMGQTDSQATAQEPKAELKKPSVNWLAVGFSIALAVVCWGSYGPFLHIGQSKMGGSRLRPFCCVGIAYFVIAVMLPVLLLESTAMHESSRYTTWGMIGSILAGVCGAMGALGIILAFTFGGKPIFVMPLVFGFAPVVNTIGSMIVAGNFKTMNLMFSASLLLGILGAVTVLLNAPKAAGHAKPAATPQPPNENANENSESNSDSEPAGGLPKS